MSAWCGRRSSGPAATPSGTRASAPRPEPNRPPSLVVLAQQGRACKPFFFPSKLDRLLQDFRFHRLLAEHALQLGDLSTGGGQFARWHHRFASRHGGEHTFAFKLAPIEKLAGADAVLAHHQRSEEHT